jgi:hypothetical protein
LKSIVFCTDLQAELQTRTGSPNILEPHLLDFSWIIAVFPVGSCSVFQLSYREENTSTICIRGLLILPYKIMSLARKRDTGKGGRSREFGGEMHGRKLTKDAINVFSEAANPRRTKSWLDARLVSSIAARDRSFPTPDRHSISTSRRDSIWYISRDYTGRSQTDGALADWALAFGTG